MLPNLRGPAGKSHPRTKLDTCQQRHRMAFRQTAYLLRERWSHARSNRWAPHSSGRPVYRRLPSRSTKIQSTPRCHLRGPRLRRLHPGDRSAVQSRESPGFPDRDRHSRRGASWQTRKTARRSSGPPGGSVSKRSCAGVSCFLPWIPFFGPSRLLQPPCTSARYRPASASIRDSFERHAKVRIDQSPQIT